METKPWYVSKTLWVNFIGVIWILFADKVGLPALDPETETSLLAVVNIVLRVVTKQGLTT